MELVKPGQRPEDTCPLCGVDDLRIIGVTDNLLWLVRCNNCGAEHQRKELHDSENIERLGQSTPQSTSSS